MKEFKVLKISSFSDVITNSSSEVYLVKPTDEFKQFEKTLENVDFVYIDNEDALKKFIMDCVKDYTLYRLESCEIDGQKLLKNNPLDNFSFSYIWDVCHENGKTDDEVYEFFKESYRPLIGYAVFAIETNEETDAIHAELEMIEANTEKYGIYKFFE